MRAVSGEAIDAVFSRAVQRPNTAAVVFSHGTIVTLPNDTPPTNALPFGEEYITAWPVERLADPADLADWIAANTDNYTTAYNRYGPIAYAATVALVDRGYLPADESANRRADPVADATYLVVYPAHPDITTIVEAENAEVAAILGGERWRFDYMFPQIVRVYVV